MNNQEAPMSVTVTLYYKGVQITITKRNNEALIKPLVEAQMQLIDWALENSEMRPSWNMDTVKQLKDKDNGDGKEWIKEDYLKCKTCGAKATRKSGTSKAGKAWSGTFCSENKEHVSWGA